MQDDRVKAELDAKRQQGAMLKCLGGIKRITSVLAGDDVQQAVRTIVEEASASPHLAPVMMAEARGKLAKQLRGGNVCWSDGPVHRG